MRRSIKKHFSDEELIEMIKEKAKELKRVPKAKEFEHYSLAYNRFGSWHNALEKAGLIELDKVKYTREQLLKKIKKDKILLEIVAKLLEK